MMSSQPHTINVIIVCRVVGSCDSWYELMVGRLLFTTPLVISTDYDLVYSAEVCCLPFKFPWKLRRAVDLPPPPRPPSRHVATPLVHWTLC